MEIWKDIEETEGLYQVSNLGRFKRLERDRFSEMILKLGKYSNGYYQFSVVIKRKRITAIAHRIVAKYFIPNPENKSQVNHKNGIKTDNRVENLEWVSHSENMKHSFRVLKNKPYDKTCEKNPNSKLKKEDVLEIRNLYKNNIITQSEISKKYNINAPAIWKIVNNRTWKNV